MVWPEEFATEKYIYPVELQSRKTVTDTSQFINYKSHCAQKRSHSVRVRGRHYRCSDEDVFIFAVILVSTVILFRPGQSSDKVRIGFILKTMQEERYQRDKSAFLARAKALGAIPIFDSCNNNEMEQISRFENMLAQGVKVIVLQPVNTQTASILVRLANERV